LELLGFLPIGQAVSYVHFMIKNRPFAVFSAVVVGFARSPFGPISFQDAVGSSGPLPLGGHNEVRHVSRGGR